MYPFFFRKQYSVCVVVAAMLVFAGPVWTQSLNLKWDDRFTSPGIRSTYDLKAIVVNGQYAYYGGTFNNIGSFHSNGLARWDGKEWKDLSAGFKLIAGHQILIQALALDSNGNLYVACDRFALDGDKTQFIAKWDGKNWQTISQSFPSFGNVDQLLVYRSHLVAVGDNLYDGFAEFEGEQWYPLSWDKTKHTTIDLEHEEQERLRKYEKDYGYGPLQAIVCNNELYQTDSKTLVRWNDSVWEVIKVPITKEFSLLNSIDSILFFQVKYPDRKYNYRHSLTSFDGRQWKNYVGAINLEPISVMKFHDSLWAFGYIQSGNNSYTNVLARWTDTGWNMIDAPMAEMAVSNGSSLFCFSSVYLDEKNPNVFVFDEAGVHDIAPRPSFGLMYDPNALVLYKNTVFISGSFKEARITQWNDNRWVELPYVPFIDTSTSVFSFTYVAELETSEEFLYAVRTEGSSFIDFSVSSDYVFRWDGNRWLQLGSIKGFEGSNDNGIEKLLAIKEDHLCAVGSFKSVDSTDCNNIAYWDGKIWMPVGGGISNKFGQEKFRRKKQGKIYTLLKQGNDLYAAGLFSEAGGDSIYGVARYDGNKWHPVGKGLFGTVLGLVSYRDELIAAGAFYLDTAANNLKHLAVLRNGSWQEFSGPVSMSESPYACLYVHDDNLYYAINPPSDSTIPQGLFRWDGISWTSLTEPFYFKIDDMLIKDGNLYVITSDSSGDISSGFGILKLDK